MGDETETRGPGRPPKPKTATVVYSPLDAGDPHTVPWNGITFRANVPKELSHATHGEMIALAKGNAHFTVDGEQYKRRRSDREAIPMAGSDATVIDDKKMVEVDD